MKKYLLLLTIPVALFSCDMKRKDKMADDSKTNAIKEAQQKLGTTVQMIDSIYNFGTITDGEKVEFSYRFKNTGTNPLVIIDAHASCGCTVPEKPENAIMPGETGFLKVVFNSSGKSNGSGTPAHTEKEINVSSNANPSFPVLKLIGEVRTKE
ncbi:MAG: DUF1573 domain-containing protein [Ferruginibacter sp.]